MYEKLKQLLKHAYCPYSNFPVACIVVMKDGQEFVGVNVENASYGATICAERSAIVSAISHGYQSHDFKQLYLMVKREKISTCCFLCRQVFTEFFDENVEFIFMNDCGDEKRFTLQQLCTYPFDCEDLK